ncbi:MAG: hypothetical protein VW715_15655 [Rhodospirillales bacterium]
MSNKRIDLTKELEWLHEPRKDRSVGTISKHDVVVETDYIEGLIAELKRCYELLDSALPHWESHCPHCGLEDYDMSHFSACTI